MVDPRFYELIKHLWRGGKYGYYWTPDGPTQTADDGSTYTVSQTYWTAAGKPSKVPPIWKNTYFGVHPTSVKYGEHRKASLDDVTCINALYAEFDAKDFKNKAEILTHIESLKFKPSVLNDSGGGYHCYWLLRDTVPVTSVTPDPAIVQHAWVRLTGGDHTVHDLARVLRIPGTLNHKYTPPAPVDIIHFDMVELYDYADLVDVCSHEIHAIQEEAAQYVHTGGGGVSLSDQELLDKAMNAPANGAQFTRLWSGDHDGDHSAADQALCNLLAYWTGKDEARMDALFRASGLYRDKWERDSYRLSTIQRAVKGVRNVYDPTPSQAYQESQRAVEGVVEMSTGKADDKPTPQAAPQGDPFLLESADDRGNAVCMWHRYGDMFAWTAGFGYLWYNGSHWTTDGAEAELRKAVTATLTERRMKAVGANHEKLVSASKPSATNVRNCIYMFQPLITTTEANFDADPNLLNCTNGVIDLRTGQLMPHDSKQRFTYCVPVEYDPNADYVEWIEFLHGVTDANLMDFLQMAVGYSATGHTREECLFYVHGPTRSGKGTFSETLLEIFPRPLGVQADFGTFTAERKGDTQNFDLAPLKPARFIVASESNKYESLNEAKVKSATGGDHIRCAFKHRDHFEYRPQFKIWLVSNHPASGDVDDDAFWGRIRVVEFPHTFKGREDKRLKQKMKSPENLRGVLAWLVSGAVRWHNEPQGLPIPQQVKDATNKHRNELDYVQQWLDECCDVDPSSKAWTANSLIYHSYSEWCQDNGLKPKGQKMLGRALAFKGFDIGERRYLSNGKRARGVTGIAVN